MAEYDNPRPASQPVGSTDQAVAKDNLISLDIMSVSEEDTFTNRKGAIRKTTKGIENQAVDAIDGIIDQFEQDAATAIAAAGRTIVGDFADAIVPINNPNEVLTSKSITDFEGYEWRTTEPLPYTRTGNDPTSGAEAGKWVAVDSSADIKAVARANNKSEGQVLKDTDTVSSIPSGALIYAGSLQRTYVPPNGAVGETIISLVSNSDYGTATLTTSGGTYEAVTLEVHALRGYAVTGFPTAELVAYSQGWGAAADGVTDDRIPLQRFLDEAPCVNLQFFKATYLVSFDTNQSTGYGLVMPSGKIVDFNFSTVRCTTNSLSNYDFIRVALVSGLEINNLTVIGDVETHTGTAGEFGHGIAIRSSSDVTLNNVHSNKCWGDGLLIGGGTTTATISENITMNNCSFDSNRRQGSSLIAGIGVTYNNCAFTNTGSIDVTAPAAGLDIEPNPGEQGDVVVDVKGCRFANNIGGAIHVILSGCLDADTIEPGICDFYVNVTNMVSNSDGATGSIGRGAIRVGGSKGEAVAGSNKIRGCINFTDTTLTDCNREAIWLTNTIAEYPPIRFNNTLATDIYNNVALGATLPTTSIIYFDVFPEFGSLPNFAIGDIEFNNSTYLDTRGDTYSATATATNHRVTRPVWYNSLDPATLFDNVTFNGFKTNIQPTTYNFLGNGFRFGQCKFTSDAITKDTTATILQSNEGVNWGLGLTPVVLDSGTQDLIIELPSTTTRVGTYQNIDSRRDTPNRLIFRAGETNAVANEVVYLDGTRTSAQTEPANPMGMFTFYCPKVGIWVQQ